MDLDSPPPLRLPDRVRRELEDHRPGLAEEFERKLSAQVRPCVAITSERVSEFPLYRGVIGRTLGLATSPPVLGVLESKFGGTPYSEPDEDWSSQTFLGQIDLEEATAVLPSDAPRLRGLLRLSIGAGPAEGGLVCARWFPSPAQNRWQFATAQSSCKWETRLRFRRSWTLPEDDWLDEHWPLETQSWTAYTPLLPEGYNEDGDDTFHRLLGHRSIEERDHYGFRPPPGLGESLHQYEQLLRLTLDSSAEFDWGTNWIYVLVPRDDLVSGDLRRLVVTGANY